MSRHPRASTADAMRVRVNIVIRKVMPECELQETHRLVPRGAIVQRRVVVAGGAPLRERSSRIRPLDTLVVVSVLMLMVGLGLGAGVGQSEAEEDHPGQLTKSLVALLLMFLRRPLFAVQVQVEADIASQFVSQGSQS